MLCIVARIGFLLSLDNLNGTFIDPLTLVSDLDLWFMNGRVLDDDVTFASSGGRSNCDTWLGSPTAIKICIVSLHWDEFSDHAQLHLQVTCAARVADPPPSICAPDRNSGRWIAMSLLSCSHMAALLLICCRP